MNIFANLSIYLLATLILVSCQDTQDTPHYPEAINYPSVSGSQYTKLSQFEYEEKKDRAEHGSPEDARRIAGHYIGLGIEEKKDPDYYKEDYQKWMLKSYRLGSNYAGIELFDHFVNSNQCDNANSVLKEMKKNMSISRDVLVRIKKDFILCGNQR